MHGMMNGRMGGMMWGMGLFGLVALATAPVVKGFVDLNPAPSPALPEMPKASAGDPVTMARTGYATCVFREHKASPILAKTDIADWCVSDFEILAKHDGEADGFKPSVFNQF